MRNIQGNATKSKIIIINHPFLIFKLLTRF